MGLDMYLYADRYVSEFMNEGDKERAAKIKELFPEFSFGEVKNIRVEVGYWRKANAIHNWFVKNVQEENDDCGNYYVPREKLQELLDLVREVLQNKGKKKSVAKSILPPTSGFFFGSTDVDEYYYEDMRSTEKILENALNLPNNLTLYYQSSW